MTTDISALVERLKALLATYEAWPKGVHPRNGAPSEEWQPWWDSNKARDQIMEAVPTLLQALTELSARVGELEDRNRANAGRLIRAGFLEGQIKAAEQRIAELKLALNEADRKNEAQLNEWNAAEQRVGELEANKAEMFTLVSKYAQEAGFEKGKREVSELAGIVEGWQDRALAAEQRADRAVELLRPFAREATTWTDDVPDHAAVIIDGCEEAFFNVGHLRAARAFIAQEGKSHD